MTYFSANLVTKGKIVPRSHQSLHQFDAKTCQFPILHMHTRRSASSIWAIAAQEACESTSSRSCEYIHCPRLFALYRAFISRSLPSFARSTLLPFFENFLGSNSEFHLLNIIPLFFDFSLEVLLSRGICVLALIQQRPVSSSH